MNDELPRTNEVSTLLECKKKCKNQMFEIYYENGLYYLAVLRGRYNFQMRYLTLILMLIQCICVVLCMKLSVTYPASDGKRYLTPIAVVIGEVLKLLTSLLMIFYISGGRSLGEFVLALKGELTYDVKGNLLICIPGILFLFQNNLTYVALERLPASVYQITAQLKVITTAIFSVIILKRRLGYIRWFACIMLFIGVILVQKSLTSRSTRNIDYLQFMVGFFASIFCSITSGLGSVIIEKVIKNKDDQGDCNLDIENSHSLGNSIGDVDKAKITYKSTVWGRNVILSLIGIFGGFSLAWFSCKEKIIKDGVFQGFSWLTGLVIFLNAYGGFIVVGVLKYSDSIMKCFFNALTIVIITLISWIFMGDNTPSVNFFISATIVIVAINIYTLNKIIPEKLSKKVSNLVNIPKVSILG
ncbi:UDP N-acetylglucosamine transporter-like nucleotide sugar transporter [Cryptosporidium felis]|nr:UDP N-acetylglucosamine transporter-like nucleotide sugar transporter [Cryptosporidium felis]